ncbi:MAG: hypothetical protein KDA22_10625 [Phycisphaerales bacterium]|nr:hypothetical protein [Phycisphaerales bacterium]
MHRCLVALVLASAMVVAPRSLQAQDAGGIPQSVIGSTRPLDSQQVAQIRAFVDQWTAQLLEGDVEEVSKARAELTKPLSGPSVSNAAIFLRQFSDAALPSLKTAVQGDSLHRAVNALIVIRSLRTPEAVEFLLARADPRTEARIPIRIRAASLLADTIIEADLPPAQLDSAIRQVAAAAARETDWLAMLHDFGVLSRIAVQPKLPSSSVAMALDGEAAALRAAVDLLASAGTASDLMHGVSRCIIVARDQFRDMPASEVKSFRLKLAPMLLKVNEIAAAHWDEAQADPALRKSYGDAVSNSELLLKLTNEKISTDLRSAWQSQDRSAFDRDLAVWKEALKRPPFTG